MKIITERDIIKNVKKEWRRQYPANSYTTKQQKQVYEKLKRLDLNKATAKQIDKIIGNTSWTTITCDECGYNTKLAVEFTFFESSCVLCLDCLSNVWTELAKMLENKKHT